MQARPCLAPSLLFALGLLAGCLAPAGVRYPNLPDLAGGALHIINFDMGQSDALLVLYNGRSLLMDAGAPRNDRLRASRRIPRRLDALQGHRHLDYFLITHYHDDHFGGPAQPRQGRAAAGIYGLLARDGVTVGTLLDRGFWRLGKKTATQLHYERALLAWLDAGVVGRRRELHPGDTIDLGPGIEVRVIAAAGNGLLDRLAALNPRFPQDSQPSENDYSVGVKITLGPFELFTAGDLSGETVLRRFGPVAESYNDIESRIAADVGAVEVYRVNHHGSAFSSNPCFVQVLHPSASVISSGDNDFGHPAPEVVERLRRYGDVWITGGADADVRDQVEASIVGEDIDIVVAPDGERYWINGTAYAALDDAQERTRPTFKADCSERLQSPAAYRLTEDRGED